MSWEMRKRVSNPPNNCTNISSFVYTILLKSWHVLIDQYRNAAFKLFLFFKFARVQTIHHNLSKRKILNRKLLFATCLVNCRYKTKRAFCVPNIFRVEVGVGMSFSLIYREKFPFAYKLLLKCSVHIIPTLTIRSICENDFISSFENFRPML